MDRIDIRIDSCLADEIENQKYIRDFIKNYLENILEEKVIDFYYSIGNDGFLHVSGIETE